MMNKEFTKEPERPLQTASAKPTAQRLRSTSARRSAQLGLLDSMYSRIYHLLKGPNPLHPSVWAGRLVPLTFRRFTPDDLPECRELYTLNEPGRFPKGGIQEYEHSLLDWSTYHLVAESSGQVIASGGIAPSHREDRVAFCYGLVHPNHQGKGIGTALILSRLALLKPSAYNYEVFIFALEKSIGFYRRFGFREIQGWRDSHGGLHPSGCLLLTPQEIIRCRALLKEHGIQIPEDQNRIPFQTATA